MSKSIYKERIQVVLALIATIFLVTLVSLVYFQIITTDLDNGKFCVHVYCTLCDSICSEVFGLSLFLKFSFKTS